MFSTFMQQWADKIARANAEELQSRVDFEVESIMDLTNRVFDKYSTIALWNEGRL